METTSYYIRKGNEIPLAPLKYVEHKVWKIHFQHFMKFVPCWMCLAATEPPLLFNFFSIFIQKTKQQPSNQPMNYEKFVTNLCASFLAFQRFTFHSEICKMSEWKWITICFFLISRQQKKRITFGWFYIFVGTFLELLVYEGIFILVSSDWF